MGIGLRSFVFDRRVRCVCRSGSVSLFGVMNTIYFLGRFRSVAGPNLNISERPDIMLKAAVRNSLTSLNILAS